MWVSMVMMAALLTSSASARAQTAPQSDEPVVVVTGEGLVKVTPDQAWVTLAVEARSKDPKTAQAQAAKAMSAVQARLLEAGVAKEAIRTLSYGLHLESDWVDGKQVTRGYVARNTIEVRLDDITRVGEIIDLAIDNGANAVHGIRFDVKSRDTLEREALKRAAADARARAEAAAAGVGATLGRVVRIEQPSASVYPMPSSPMMMRESAQADKTPVVAGEIEIRAAVTLTATIK